MGAEGDLAIDTQWGEDENDCDDSDDDNNDSALLLLVE